MKLVRIMSLNLSTLTLALVLGLPDAQAQDGLVQGARLGEHPAVLVARRGVHPDPNANFYLHPARLEWSLQRPDFDEERSAAAPASQPASVPAEPVQTKAQVALEPGAVPTTAAAAIR